ncbi:hypothetical protein [Salinilacihabitans rarus]|uniref:hypothetical protein n=1 Tax=Salinilacihabitans rarus TaxID=2961596 RepID=UPI0020C937BC|nr:hypothetical protein [Salinilacihabitans rarus]
MTTESQRTTADSESESMRATRRTVLFGTGVAGLLTLGVSSASAGTTEDEARLRAEEAEEEARLRAEETEEEARLRAEEAEEEARLRADHIPVA